MMNKSDDEITAIVKDSLHSMLKLPIGAVPDFIHISRHARAIPQYEVDSEQRLLSVSKIEGDYPGLIIGGNLRDGIGMGHRITQASNIVKRIIKSE
jgi:oxygen-dependent protoporphyrinogen oxidase